MQQISNLDPTSPAIDRDRDLARRARGGSIAAFSELVDRHRDVVYRICSRMVGPDDADDVTQEALLRAFHRIDRFRGEGPFRAWLLGIAHHAALDTLAYRARYPSLARDDDAPAPNDAARVRTPAEELERSEQRERLDRKLQLLRPAHRSVLVLRDLEGFSYEQISDLTDQPLGSVKGRLSRARSELIEILRSNTYDWELPDEL